MGNVVAPPRTEALNPTWSLREEARCTGEVLTIHIDSAVVHIEFTWRAENRQTVRPLALIENDYSFSSEVRRTLESAGFHVDSFHRGIDALAPLRTRSFSMAIVGLDLTDTDPFSVCREASRFVPVLTIAHDCAEDLCIRALESGADDCVARPIAGRELVVRIRNLLRRGGLAETGGDASETLELSVAAMRVRSGEQTYDLTSGESELLALLLRYSPTPLSTSELAELLGTKRGTIESRIKSLRRKIGVSRLVTRGGFGYVLETDEPRRHTSGSRGT